MLKENVLLISLLVSLSVTYVRTINIDNYVKEVLDSYRELRSRPCTIVILNNGSTRRSLNFKSHANDPNFQYLYWKLDTFNLNQTFHTSGKSFTFSTGCTIFIATGNDVEINEKIFKYLSRQVDEQFWIIYGLTDVRFTEWPVLNVQGNKALLHCSHEKKPRVAKKMCPKEPQREQETLKVSTFVLKPDVYVVNGQFKGNLNVLLFSAYKLKTH